MSNDSWRSHRLALRTVQSWGCMALPLTYLSLYSSLAWQWFGEHCLSPFGECVQEGKTWPMERSDFQNDTYFLFFYMRNNFETQNGTRANSWWCLTGHSSSLSMSLSLWLRKVQSMWMEKADRWVKATWEDENQGTLGLCWHVEIRLVN